jgi:uncharacterized protein (TIGR03435 family)
MRICATLVLAFSAAAFGVAQLAAPQFDAASIKPGDTGGNYVEVTPAGLIAHSATLATCIKWAYGVQFSQISGADSPERYDIIAKTSGPVPPDELRQMFQGLLAERFKLALHRQTREMQVYALEIEKQQPKFHESQGDGESQQQAKSKLSRQWKWTTMAQLADSLSDAMESKVIDHTGLSGRYDFSLDLTPYLPADRERPDLPGMMLTAIREQLGLKLAAIRAPVEMLVIDHVEKPSAN